MSLPLKLRWNHPASLLLLVLLTACGRREGSLEVTNLNPVPVMVAIRYPWSPDSVATQGWYRLEAGETRTFRRRFRGVRTGFAVHGHTAGDPALMRWLHKQSAGQPGRRYFSGPLSGPVMGQAFAFRTAADADAAAPGARTAGFVRVPPLEEGGRKHLVVLKDPLFQAVYAAARGERDSIGAAAAQMARLGPALANQHWFVTRFADPVQEFPFGLAAVADPNGRFVAGVDVEEAPSTTIWGDPYPLLPGDRVLSLAGRDVFSAEDLMAALWIHATDTLEGGIRRPLAFTALRNGERVSGKTTYFFNDAHFGRSGRDETRALVRSVVDNTLFGFGCRVGSWLRSSAEMSRSRRRWNCDQENARLKQMYRKSYNAGAWVALLLPVGGGALTGGAKAVKGARVARTARTALTTGTVFTVAGSLARSFNSRSPLAGVGDVVIDATTDIALDMGIQVVFATDFSLLGEPTPAPD